MRPPNRRHPLATIKPPVLFCGPRLLIAPGLEIGLGAFRQVVPPRRFQRRAGRLEGWRGATAVIAGFGSGIEAALAIASVLRRSGCRRTCAMVPANPHVSVMDLPAGDTGRGIGAADEDGHAAIQADGYGRGNHYARRPTIDGAAASPLFMQVPCRNARFRGELVGDSGVANGRFGLRAGTMTVSLFACQIRTLFTSSMTTPRYGKA